MENARSACSTWMPPRKSSGAKLLVVRTSTRLASISGALAREVALLPVFTAVRPGRKMARHRRLDLFLEVLRVSSNRLLRSVPTETLATFLCIKMAIKGRLRPRVSRSTLLNTADDGARIGVNYGYQLLAVGCGNKCLNIATIKLAHS